MLEKTLESLMDSREIKPVLKEINPEYSLEGLMLKLKLQYFGHLMQRASSLKKNSDAGKDWRKKEKRVAEDEMVRWHHWLNGHESEQTPGDSEGQGSLVCCSPWSPKESDLAERWNNLACRWCAPRQPGQDPPGCQVRAGRQQMVPCVPQKIGEVFLVGKMSLKIMSPVGNIRLFTAGAKCWDMVCKCHKQLRIEDWRWH